MTFKKIGLLSLMGVMTLSLAACGKNKDLSFDEAQQVFNKNSEVLNQMILGTTTNQQNIELETTIQDNDGMKMDIAFKTQSEQDKQNNKSKRSIIADANILNSGESVAVSGSILALLNKDTVFFKIEELGISSSDPSMAMISMITNGIKWQRWKLPLEGTGAMMEGMNSYLTTLSDLQSKNADLYVETGKSPYQGKFSQFHGENAYQFTIDQQKYQELIKEVLTAMETFSSSLQTAEQQTLQAQDIQIPVFDGNFVIIDADQVMMVIDTMEIVVGETQMIGEYRYGSQGMYLQLRDKTTEQTIITMDIQQQKNQNYTLKVDLADVLMMNGDVIVDLSSSQAKLGFDGEIDLYNIPELPEQKMTIPLKGTRSYKTIKTVDFEEPTDAVDMMEMLWGMMGMGMMDLEEGVYTDTNTPEIEQHLPVEILEE